MDLVSALAPSNLARTSAPDPSSFGTTPIFEMGARSTLDGIMSLQTSGLIATVAWGIKRIDKNYAPFEQIPSEVFHAIADNLDYFQLQSLRATSRQVRDGLPPSLVARKRASWLDEMILNCAIINHNSDLARNPFNDKGNLSGCYACAGCLKVRCEEDYEWVDIARKGRLQRSIDPQTSPGNDPKKRLCLKCRGKAGELLPGARVAVRTFSGKFKATLVVNVRCVKCGEWDCRPDASGGQIKISPFCRMCDKESHMLWHPIMELWAERPESPTIEEELDGPLFEYRKHILTQLGFSDVGVPNLSEQTLLSYTWPTEYQVRSRWTYFVEKFQWVFLELKRGQGQLEYSALWDEDSAVRRTLRRMFGDKWVGWEKLNYLAPDYRVQFMCLPSSGLSFNIATLGW